MSTFGSQGRRGGQGTWHDSCKTSAGEAQEAVADACAKQERRRCSGIHSRSSWNGIFPKR